ncbi:MAG: hypothetical protein K2X35_11025 [Bryobacteraceae bacterium]|nr:hypothetical protein [Bryobacteraceae bacterium]
MPRKPTKRSELSALIAVRGITAVGDAEFEAISQALQPVSASHLRRLLRESGLELAPWIEGVRQGSFDELETSLTRLYVEQEKAAAAGDPELASKCRQCVIEAKDHARLSLSRLTGGRRRDREEMIQWMLIWLENPSVFLQWLRLRRRIIPVTL